MGIPGVFPQRQQANKDTERPRATVVLPYTHGLLEPLRRILAPLHIRTCVFVRSEPYLTSLFTQKILCHLTRERELCIGSPVLSVDCDMTYVGQTGRLLSCCISNYCPPISQLSPNSCCASVLKQVFVTPLLYH